MGRKKFYSVLSATLLNQQYGKRWQLYISPQYFANLTEPLVHSRRKTYFREIHPCTNKIVYARFEVFGPFLCIFMLMSGFRIFSRALRIMGKYTSRHLFRYGGFPPFFLALFIFRVTDY